MENVIGKRIRFYRRLRNMSQRELAEAVGYATKASINKIESGEAKAPTEKIKRIASILRVNFTDLANDKPIDDGLEEAKEAVNEINMSSKSNETLELQQIVNAYCNASEEGKAMFRKLAELYL